MLEHIEYIISSSRYGDELFFTDCKKAATDILSFHKSENLLTVNEVIVEIPYSGQSKAA